MNAALFVGQSAANMRLPPCCDSLKTNIKTKFSKNRTCKLEVYIFSDVPHTRLAAARLFFGNCGIGSEALIWTCEAHEAGCSD